MKKISIIALCLLLSGCSIFKKSTDKKTSQTNQTEVKDILTSTDEQIDIEIPPRLFALIYGKQIEPGEAKKDSADKKEKGNSPKKVEKPEQDIEPVKIKINRKTNTQNNSTIDTKKKKESTKEHITEKKSKDFIGNFKWLILVVGATIIGIAIIVIKFYL